jgi:hypothetical protein
MDKRALVLDGGGVTGAVGASCATPGVWPAVTIAACRYALARAIRFTGTGCGQPNLMG